MANKVSEMFEGLTNNFKGMIDANSVVGEPIIVNDGTMIVPISKVSFGFGGGGCEFDRKKNDTQSLDDKNFGGGMGGGAVLDQRFAAERPASGVDGTALGQAGKIGLGAAQQAVFLQQIVLIFAEQQLAVMQVGDRRPVPNRW